MRLNEALESHCCSPTITHHVSITRTEQDTCISNHPPRCPIISLAIRRVAYQADVLWKQHPEYTASRIETADLHTFDRAFHMPMNKSLREYSNTSGMDLRVNNGGPDLKWTNEFKDPSNFPFFRLRDLSYTSKQISSVNGGILVVTLEQVPTGYASI